MASLGASLSLVAGAALSLLVVSFVFAYDGLVGGGEQSTSHAALRVEALSPPDRGDGAGAARSPSPVIVRTAPERTRASVVARPARRARETGRVRTRPVVVAPDVGDQGTTTAPPPQSGPGAPTAGDGVRELGEAVSGTVQGAGQTAAPLGPPVTKTIQDVLDLITAVLRRAGGAVAGAVDALTGRPPG